MRNQVDLTAQKIYDTTIEIVQTSKCFNYNRFDLLSSEDNLLNNVLESIVDLLGSTNNLIVALGSKSIKYNKDDLEYALFIAKKESGSSEKKYEKIINNFSKQRLMSFFTNRLIFGIPITSLITLLCYILILEIFQLDKALISIPIIALFLIMINLLIYHIKLNKAWEKHNIILVSIYLIESLISRQP